MAGRAFLREYAVPSLVEAKGQKEHPAKSEHVIRTLLLDQRVVPVVGVVGISAPSISVKLEFNKLVSISALVTRATFL